MGQGIGVRVNIEDLYRPPIHHPRPVQTWREYLADCKTHPIKFCFHTALSLAAGMLLGWVLDAVVNAFWTLVILIPYVKQFLPLFQSSF